MAKILILPSLPILGQNLIDAFKAVCESGNFTRAGQYIEGTDTGSQVKAYVYGATQGQSLGVFVGKSPTMSISPSDIYDRFLLAQYGDLHKQTFYQGPLPDEMMRGPLIKFASLLLPRIGSGRIVDRLLVAVEDSRATYIHPDVLSEAGISFPSFNGTLAVAPGADYPITFHPTGIIVHNWLAAIPGIVIEGETGSRRYYLGIP